MSGPFSTSLRRDPDDRRGLKERIDALIRERLEEAIDAACLDLLVQARRGRGLPPPVADNSEDRAEFHAAVLALLERLEAAVAPAVPADQRPHLPATPSAGDETGRLIARQVMLARLLPDYWQRFDAVQGELRRE